MGRWEWITNCTAAIPHKNWRVRESPATHNLLPSRRSWGNLLLFKSLRVLSVRQGRTDFIQKPELKVFVHREDRVCETVHPAGARTQSPGGICVCPHCGAVDSCEILALLSLNELLPQFMPRLISVLSFP